MLGFGGQREWMEELCFKKRNSDPPVCGVHHVELMQKRIPIDPNAPELGRILCNLCPVSQAIVLDHDRSSDNLRSWRDKA
jgi:hypothetical protein